MGQAGKQYLKIPYDAALYIMPTGYEDGGPDPPHGGATMTCPARLLAITPEAKLYLWQRARSKALEKDPLDALLK